MSDARKLDQFFTTVSVARACVAKLQDAMKAYEGKWLWVEPSAGGGAFLDAMPSPKIGLDIEPARSDISKIDFLSWDFGYSDYRVAVVGNPPFGKNSSLARRFFDHSAAFADIVAFIVPRTFQKPNFVNRLDPNMHLIFEEVLADNSFEFEGEPYAVPTVFQIWEKRELKREINLAPRQHKDFSFVAATDAHFAFQRVGARAGLVSREGLRKSPQSHYFIKANIEEESLFHRLGQIDWTPIKSRTAGNPSIGKGELISGYQTAFG
jgi:hypothetical protein